MLTMNEIKPIALSTAFGVMTTCAIKTGMDGNLLSLDMGLYIVAALANLTFAIVCQKQLRT